MNNILSVSEITKTIDEAANALALARDFITSEKLEPLMTIEDIASYWKCSTSHVYKMESAGHIKRANVPGLVRFNRSDILNLRVDIEA